MVFGVHFSASTTQERGVRAIAVIVALLAQSAVLNAWGQGRPDVYAYDQAAALLRQGKITEAEGVLRAELQARPEDVRELDLLGTILDPEKRFDEAEEIYTRALTIEPDSPSLLNNLGNHSAMRGQIERARFFYSRVVVIGPRHANANLHLAQISIGHNDGKTALEYLDNLQPADRSSPTAQLLRVQGLHLGGQRAAGLEVLKHLEMQYAKTLSVVSSVGLIYAEWGLYDDAERAFTSALGSDPSDVDVLYNLGLAATHAGHLKRAEEAFQAELGQRPGDVDALMGLARTCAAQGQNARSVELLNKAHQLAPQRPESL
jgi:Flp pilus assembly protein TadD